MRRFLTRAALAAPFLFAAAIPLGCETQGPAEQAGEKVDNATDKATGEFNPGQGPAEAAGEKVDKATGNKP